MRLMTHAERVREDKAYESGYECTRCGERIGAASTGTTRFVQLT